MRRPFLCFCDTLKCRDQTDAMCSDLTEVAVFDQALHIALVDASHASRVVIVR